MGLIIRDQPSKVYAYNQMISIEMLLIQGVFANKCKSENWCLFLHTHYIHNMEITVAMAGSSYKHQGARGRQLAIILLAKLIRYLPTSKLYILYTGGWGVGGVG